MKKKLIIADMYRAKNKLSFFAIHQAITKLNEFDIEFHIIWDDLKYSDEWTEKIHSLDCNLISYTKEQLNDYCREWKISEETIKSFDKFKSIYFIIHGHYLKSKGISNYYLIYDDDIILRDDLNDFKYCLTNEIPCLISEPLNVNCDKVLAPLLFNMYGGNIAYQFYKQRNPQGYGFNAGIQGVSLDMYEDFLTEENFEYLLSIFDCSGIFDETGKEITGHRRTMIDTQQQSFFGIMNIIKSKTEPIILDPNNYFVCPNWGYHPIHGNIDIENEHEGWDIAMKSKIVHFIGHTFFNGVYYGKSKIYHQLVDSYLKQYNLL
jgi:hypothetical protein